jgi:glucose/arabinose dehydrogenase
MHGHGRIALIFWFCLLTGILILSACSGGATSGGTNPAAIATTAPTNGPGGPTAPAALPSATKAAEATQPLAGVQGPTATADRYPAPGPTAPAAAQPEATKTISAGAGQGSGQKSVPADTVKALPDPTAFTWRQIVTGLQRPLAIANLPGDSGHMLVLEQAGTIRVIQNGSILPDPFLDITAKVGSQGNEQGLLGIALHPDYAKNGFFYINYTDQQGNTVIARYTTSTGDPNHADPGSEKVLFNVDQPFSNHNGGSMVFGPDGFLYMGLGDGGSGGDPHGNGQSTDTLLGKILRVDVNNGDPYAIPAGNPFQNGGGRPEIWAYGLRNPWRFSFDRLTGDLLIADVGQDSWEEIDFLPAGSPGGANFGWNFREGKHPFRGNPPAALKLIDPVYDYAHNQGCSVTGGYVYRGQALPEFRGVYIFADYCSGRVWGLLRGADGSWQAKVLFNQTGMNITSFGEDINGELYAIDQATGGVYRLERQ